MFRAIPELAGNSILLPHQNSLNDLMISAIFHFYLLLWNSSQYLKSKFYNHTFEHIRSQSCTIWLRTCWNVTGGKPPKPLLYGIKPFGSAREGTFVCTVGTMQLWTLQRRTSDLSGGVSRIGQWHCVEWTHAQYKVLRTKSAVVTMPDIPQSHHSHDLILALVCLEFFFNYCQTLLWPPHSVTRL